jgi:hypothetical protein
MRNVCERKDAHRVLVKKPEEKKQLGRSRGTWDDDIKLHLRDIRF